MGVDAHRVDGEGTEDGALAHLTTTGTFQMTIVCLEHIR